MIDTSLDGVFGDQLLDLTSALPASKRVSWAVNSGNSYNFSRTFYSYTVSNAIKTQITNDDHVYFIATIGRGEASVVDNPTARGFITLNVRNITLNETYSSVKKEIPLHFSDTKTASFDLVQSTIRNWIANDSTDALAIDLGIEVVGTTERESGNFVFATAQIRGHGKYEDELDEFVDGKVKPLVDSEQAARETADRTLQRNIDAEKTARETADTTLQDNIDTEESERESADTALQEAIDNIPEPPVAYGAEFPATAENGQEFYITKKHTDPAQLTAVKVINSNNADPRQRVGFIKGGNQFNDLDNFFSADKGSIDETLDGDLLFYWQTNTGYTQFSRRETEFKKVKTITLVETDGTMHSADFSGATVHEFFDKRNKYQTLNTSAFAGLGAGTYGLIVEFTDDTFLFHGRHFEVGSYRYNGTSWVKVNDEDDIKEDIRETYFGHGFGRAGTPNLPQDTSIAVEGHHIFGIDFANGWGGLITSNYEGWEDSGTHARWHSMALDESNEIMDTADISNLVFDAGSGSHDRIARFAAFRRRTNTTAESMVWCRGGW